jgi:hypothetical protein
MDRQTDKREKKDKTPWACVTSIDWTLRQTERQRLYLLLLRDRDNTEKIHREKDRNVIFKSLETGIKGGK